MAVLDFLVMFAAGDGEEYPYMIRQMDMQQHLRQSLLVIPVHVTGKEDKTHEVLDS